MKAEPILWIARTWAQSVILRLRLLLTGLATATGAPSLGAGDLTPMEGCFHQELGGQRHCSPEVRALRRGPL